jgi:hypothetical protein
MTRFNDPCRVQKEVGPIFGKGNVGVSRALQ